MARVLFLDDDLERHERFRSIVKDCGYDVAFVETPEQAKQALNLDRFDIASLDHDLFGKVYQPSDERSGFAVAQYIGQMAIRPRKVLCHSWNATGASKMLAVLRDAGCHSYSHPFDTSEYWDEVIAAASVEFA